MNTEINSVTDNPIIFVKEDKIISGGNFHGQPLAYILDFLKISLAELGNISERDYQNYSGLFSVMVSYLKKPDLIVYLRASTDTLLSRIEKRGRDYEGSISPEYLDSLNISYDRWINSEKDYPVLIVETDDFNIFDDLHQVQEIQDMILDRI